jgi:predicted outer membrane lipoprotein
MDGVACLGFSRIGNVACCFVLVFRRWLGMPLACRFGMYTGMGWLTTGIGDRRMLIVIQRALNLEKEVQVRVSAAAVL